MRPRYAWVSFSWLAVLTYTTALPCGWGQNISGIFLTPVTNAPFFGVIVVERTTVGSDGPVSNLKTTREVGRATARGAFTYSSKPVTMEVHIELNIRPPS